MSNNMIYSISIMVYFIISEYLPDIFALDYSFMMTYFKKQTLLSDEEKDIVNTRKTSNLQGLENFTRIMDSPKNSSHDENSSEENISDLNKNIQIPSFNNGTQSLQPNVKNKQFEPIKKLFYDILVKVSDIQFLEQIHTKKNTLGVIFKSKVFNKEFSCRSVKFDRLSRYDLEGISKDIEELL
jgi:hypothetical protein